MALALMIVGVAFAAFCVWLAVRIINRRNKPGKAFWVNVVLVLALVGYPLSFAPAVHLYVHGILPGDAAIVIYRPIRGVLHAVLMRHSRRKLFTQGSEKVSIAMEQLNLQR
jgi:hypothetical protein